MSEILKQVGLCPQCGAPLKGGAPMDPAAALELDRTLYDLEALAVEASEDKAYDESAKVRVTQQDIRNLLEKRRKTHK
jgi:hypothetical protein